MRFRWPRSLFRSGDGVEDPGGVGDRYRRVVLSGGACEQWLRVFIGVALGGGVCRIRYFHPDCPDNPTRQHCERQMSPAVLAYITAALGLIPSIITAGGDVATFIAEMKADIAAFGNGSEPTAAQWTTLITQVNAANAAVQSTKPAPFLPLSTAAAASAIA